MIENTEKLDKLKQLKQLKQYLLSDDFENKEGRFWKKIGKLSKKVFPYILTSTILTTIFASNDENPFKRDVFTEYYTGDVERIDSLNNRDIQNGLYGVKDLGRLYYTGKWALNKDNIYERERSSYYLKDISSEETINLFNKDKVTLDDILGEPYETTLEHKNKLTDKELSKNAYYEAVILDKDNRTYHVVKESFSENLIDLFIWLLIISPIWAEIADYRRVQHMLNLFYHRNYPYALKLHSPISKTLKLIYKEQN